MKRNQSVTFFLLLILFGCKNSTSNKSTKIAGSEITTKPIVSFTFNNGITTDIANFKFEKWNEMPLSHL